MTLDASQRKGLRTAGVLYFLMLLTAPIGLLYVPGEIIVPGDAAATADQIRSSEWLLRLGIGSELFHQVVVVFLVFALYRLFKPVDVTQARLLVALGALVSVPIMFVNTLNYVAAITLAGGADFLASFDQKQLDALAYVFVRLHSRGIDLAAFFWGLWLFPFGILIIRSGFIPKILGYLMYVAGVGYLAASTAIFIAPWISGTVGPVAMILELGELPTVLWFFYRAIRPPQSS